MASAPGRGAQVRIKDEHQAAARGAAGRSLLDNLLAKRREESRGTGSDGALPDGSTRNGVPALDEVLTPGGRLDGFLPGPQAPGAMRGALSVSTALSGAIAGAPPRPGAMQGFMPVRTDAAGSIAGRTFGLAGSMPVSVAMSGTPQALGAMRGELAVRSAFAAALAGPGPMRGTVAVSTRIGSGLFGEARVATALAGSLRGAGALAGAVAASTGLSGTLGARAGSPGRVAATVALSGNLTGAAGVVVTPGTVSGRSGEPVTLRDGTALEARPSASEAVLGRDGSAVTLRDGSPLVARAEASEAVTDRQGVPITGRDGERVAKRALPDVVEPPPPGPDPTPDPTPEPVVYPTGPHLRLDTQSPGHWGAAVVKRQDGRTAELRLVRPLYPLTGYADLRPHNTAAFPENFYFSDTFDGRFRHDNGELYLGREMTSADDGTYRFTIFRNMSDGTVLSLDMTVTIAADAAAVNPQPTPAPTTPQVFFEPFDEGRGLGALIKHWQKHRIKRPGAGTVLLDGSDVITNADGSKTVPGTSMMTLTSPDYVNRPEYGFMNGLFEFRARFYGDAKGDGPGPAIILWPADDVWPGSEIDLGELMDDGTFYLAIHRKHPVTGEDDDRLWAPKDNPEIAPGGVFDHKAWHTYGALLTNTSITLLVDGKVLAKETDPGWVAPDALNGGVNHTVGLQNASSQTKLECDWIRWTPEAKVAAPPDTGGGAPPPPAKATNTVGTGPDALALKLTQDAYQGDAQYTVKVDGVQVGGTQTAVALRGSGVQDTLTVLGNWASGTRTAAVEFLNDDYGGTAATDRNLYLEGATFNGAAVPNSTLTLLSAGTQTFPFTKAGTGTGPPPTAPGGKVLMGIYRGNNTSDLVTWENFVGNGKQAEAVLAYTGNADWGNCDPGWQIGSSQFVGGSGREALWSIPNFPQNDGLARMREAANGQHDAKYTDWATKILNATPGTRDIHVRTCWELGGEWFWWTVCAQQDPAAFIGAFRRFADRFHAVSPRFKIAFDWVPDRGKIEQWYPGDAYVDVLSQDVYWHVAYNGIDPALAFRRSDTGQNPDGGFSTDWRGLAWMKQFARDRGKPMAIPEFGVPGANGNTYDGATYIRLMRDWCAANRVLYLVYWDSEAGGYNGLLSDNNPSGTAAAIRELYTNGIPWTA